MEWFSVIIDRIKYRIKKLCDFIKLGWNDYDHYDSLLTLEKYKLSKMADRQELIAEDIDRHFMESWPIIRDLRLFYLAETAETLRYEQVAWHSYN